MNSIGMTGWCQALKGKLTLTASGLFQDFDLPIFVPLPGAGFTSKDMAWVLGANYVASPRDTLYASYTDATVSGGTSNEYRRLTLGASRVITPRDRVEAEVNFGDFWDNLDSTLDFSSDLWRVTYRRDF